MVQKSKPRIAFYINLNESWMGGINYYKNLFLSLKYLENKQYEYFIFMPLSSKKYQFEQYCEEYIIYDNNFLIKFADTLEFYIGKYGIDLISHMAIFSDRFKCKVINWIPDFQHKYLPEYFSEQEIFSRNEKFELYAKYSNKVLLSSYDAQNDFYTFFPKYKEKAAVLQFVASIDFNELNKSFKEFKNSKFENKRFFFLPNQFWQHKNHLTVFKSILELKKRGHEIKLFCSGYMEDYRNKEYIFILKKFILDNKLQNNVELLGVIPYSQLYLLMCKSICVINPSLFEGWSTTVEECKSLSKNIILSDLKVHKEQNPLGYYFSPMNYLELADIMEKQWLLIENRNIMIDTIDLESEVKKRLINMAKTYESIIDDILKNE